MKKDVKKITSWTAAGLSILAAYSAVSIGLPSAFYAGFELIDKREKSVIEAKLKDKGKLALIQTHGHLAYADLETEGKCIRVYDGYSVLNGKIFPNTILPELEEGGRYRFEIESSPLIGNYCLNAEQIK